MSLLTVTILSIFLYCLYIIRREHRAAKEDKRLVDALLKKKLEEMDEEAARVFMKDQKELRP